MPSRARSWPSSVGLLAALTALAVLSACKGDTSSSSGGDVKQATTEKKAPLDPLEEITADDPSRALAENVLLIIVDTLRADHLGVYGYTRATSPNIDAMAAESIVFDSAYSHAPWTKPAVASIFTGLPPRDHGVHRWKHVLEDRHLTLAEHLAGKGFHTMGAVSHVIFRPGHGYEQGFQDYDHAVIEGRNPHKVVSSEHITNAAIEMLGKRPKAKPFFMWLHYFDPHQDYIAHPEHDFGTRRIDRYDSEIAFADAHIGRLLEHMKAEGLYDNTIIVFVADHGEEFMEHGLNGHTRTLYDELVRVPMIMRIPGVPPARVSELVATSDITPTLVDMLGLGIPRAFTSAAVMKIENGAIVPPKDRAIYMETRRGAKLRGLRYGEYKYVLLQSLKQSLLFHLPSDPKELKDLSSEQHEKNREYELKVKRHYSRKRAEAKSAEMTKELQEELKSLGYL